MYICVRLLLLLLFLNPYMGKEVQGKVEFNYLTSKDGLSNSQVNAISQDKEGFIWLATQSGLNRFDGFRIRTYLYDNMNNTSIPNNAVQDIQVDFQGNLWVQTSVGYCLFDSRKEVFIHDVTGWLKKYGISGKPDKIYVDSKDNMWFVIYGVGCYFLDTSTKNTYFFKMGKDGAIPNLNVNCFAEVNGTVVISMADGTLCRLNGLHHRVLWVNRQLARQYKLRATGSYVHIDNKGNYWVLTNGTAYVYDVNNCRWYQGVVSYCQSLGIKSPVKKNILVRDVVKTNNGKLWIASDHDGLFLLDFKTKTCQQYLKDSNFNGGICDNSLQCLFVDKKNSVWIGSYSNGVSFYSPDFSKFSTIPLGDVCTITEDLMGNYWCGTNDAGILCYNPHTGQIKKYGSAVTGLKSDVVVSSVTMSDGTMYFGSFNGGMVSLCNGKWKTYSLSSTGLANNSVWCLARLKEDKLRRLLIGTLGGGLQIFNPSTDSFHTFNTQNSKIASDYINSLSVPSCYTNSLDSEVLVGHSQNFSIINIYTHKITNIKQTKEGKLFASPSTNAVIRDSRGIYWLATPAGFNMYDPNTGQLENINELNGTQGAVACSVVEGKDNTIWLISEFIVTHVKLFKNKSGIWELNMVSYNSLDGLQNRQFNCRSALVAHNGDIVLGGKNGVNIIHPQDLHVVSHNSKVRFCGLLLLGHLIRVGEEYEGKVLLHETLDISRNLDLSYKNNTFSIQLASSDVAIPSRCRFMYRMEGVFDKWMMTAAGNPEITFANLASGSYTLQVKVVNGDGTVNAEISELKIKVRPPFYLSMWAIFVYVLLGIGVFYEYRRRMLEKQEAKFERAKMEADIRRNKELNELKLNFFTNVSHELRTPLTLIISPVKKMINEEIDKEKKRKLELILRNGERLLQLVNQILDFRKIEQNKSKLLLSQVDVVQFVSNICGAFKILGDNNISLSFYSAVPKLIMALDADKVGKIVNNLLSNAYKFTPDGGKVTVSLNVVTREEQENKCTDILRLRVADTGTGINDEAKKHVFERFYQVDGTEMQPYGGSGIGLNLVMKFTKLHGGNVWVEDNEGGGTVFIVDLPITPSVTENVETEKEKSAEDVDIPTNACEGERNRPIVLLVDDSNDFREFMRDVLNTEYSVIEACNGKEAWEKIKRQRPDLILSDVMMPEIDGNQLCKLVKGSSETSSIPFVMLTARMAQNHKREGFECGADEYITKPFDIDFLNLRIKNLIGWGKRSLGGSIYGMEMAGTSHDNSEINRKNVENTTEYVMTNNDKKFLSSVDTYIRDNMSDPEASVEAMSSCLCMSRVQLYKRMVSLTGTTPSEYMRAKRIKHAEELLHSRDFNISEIAYMVGFNNPRYFSKYFQETYGMTPSQYKKNLKN